MNVNDWRPGLCNDRGRCTLFKNHAGPHGFINDALGLETWPNRYKNNRYDAWGMETGPTMIPGKIVWLDPPEYNNSISEWIRSAGTLIIGVLIGSIVALSLVGCATAKPPQSGEYRYKNNRYYYCVGELCDDVTKVVQDEAKRTGNLYQVRDGYLLRANRGQKETKEPEPQSLLPEPYDAKLYFWGYRQ